MDVLSYFFVVGALLWWKRPAAAGDALSEQFLGAFRAGLRYTRASHELHVVMLRAFVFFLFASSVWALLPLVARQMLNGTAGFYGLLLGAVGVGAIAAAVLMPKLRVHLDVDGLVLLASWVTAALFFAPPRWLALVLLLLLGGGWIIALTTLNGVAQGILPNWVRGRGLAVYLTVFNGAMAAGSLAWGLVAQRIGVAPALLAGAVGLALVALGFHRVRLPAGEADLQASNHWPEPLLADPVDHDRGPVLVLIEYLLRREDRAGFVEVMQRLSAERRRDGAYAWGLSEDSADPERIVEWFLVESWAEHLRQHRRVSKADADIQTEAAAFHRGPDPPKVQHLLALNTAAPPVSRP